MLSKSSPRRRERSTDGRTHMTRIGRRVAIGTMAAALVVGGASAAVADTPASDYNSTPSNPVPVQVLAEQVEQVPVVSPAKVSTSPAAAAPKDELPFAGSESVELGLLGLGMVAIGAGIANGV